MLHLNHCLLLRGLLGIFKNAVAAHCLCFGRLHYPDAGFDLSGQAGIVWLVTNPSHCSLQWLVSCIGFGRDLDSD